MSADVLAELRAKLRARKGKPGFGANVAEIERLIAEAEERGFVWRKTETYQFVSAEYAAAHPQTTFKTRIR